MECKQTTLTIKLSGIYNTSFEKNKAPMRFLLKIALKLLKEKLQNFLSI
jgi:hypothetical protein